MLHIPSYNIMDSQLVTKSKKCLLSHRKVLIINLKICVSEAKFKSLKLNILFLFQSHILIKGLQNNWDIFFIKYLKCWKIIYDWNIQKVVWGPMPSPLPSQSCSSRWSDAGSGQFLRRSGRSWRLSSTSRRGNHCWSHCHQRPRKHIKKDYYIFASRSG